MMGVSLKISLRRCWFCIRCHFPISILFRPGKACWYCVTKGIRSFLRQRICFSVVGLFLFPSSCASHLFHASHETLCSTRLAQASVMQANFFLVRIQFSRHRYLPASLCKIPLKKTVKSKLVQKMACFGWDGWIGTQPQVPSLISSVKPQGRFPCGKWEACWT